MAKKRTNFIYIFLILLCIAGIIFFMFLYWSEMRPRIEAENIYEEARTLAFPEVKDLGDPEIEEKRNDSEDKGRAGLSRSGPPDFDVLQAWNPDIVAWIYSPGTGIDYPVVKGSDNEFYLNHTVDKNRSIIGSIFMESANSPDFSDDITVLYGHHIKGGRMFSSLSGYKNQSYYDSHPTMKLYTKDENYDIELFAGNIVNGSIEGFPLRFSQEEQRKQWINQCLQNSTFRSKIEPDVGDKMIVLCTCTYEYQNARYIIYGILKKQQADEVSHGEK